MIENNVVSVDLVRKGESLFTLPYRIIMFIIGLGHFVIACLLCITIIGAIIGIPMLAVASGFMVGATGSQQVTCPHCGYRKNKVSHKALNFKCMRCRNLTVVNWRK